jgi:hypothetical protein
MAIPWSTNLLHFPPNKLFKKWSLIWHYFVWQLFWLLFPKLGDFLKSSGHPDSSTGQAKLKFRKTNLRQYRKRYFNKKA